MDGIGYDTGVYVEDGVEAYSDHEFGKKSFPAIAVGRILYGQWWRDVTPLYTSKYIQRVRATFPDSLRPELYGMSSRAISETPLTGPDMNEIVSRYFKNLGVRIPDDITHIVVAPHSDLLADKPELSRRIEVAVSDLEDTKLAVKYHPRDKSAEFLDFNAFTIPAQIPIEMVYIAKENLDHIIGGRSTAVITAKWLTNAEVLSVYRGWTESDHVIDSVLSDIGVRAIEGTDSSL